MNHCLRLLTKLDWRGTNIAQGLKPTRLLDSIGMTEVMPCYKTVVEQICHQHEAVYE
jgi:hypothetical protein